MAEYDQHAFLPLELQVQDPGFAMFQPRSVTVRRATLNAGEAAEEATVHRVLGFVVAGAISRARDPRRAAGVYVWHVHEPALCGQLLAGDRILQIGENITSYATVDDVRRLLLQGNKPTVRMMVRCDPAGYAALIAEMEEAGQQPEQLLATRLKTAGLPLEEPSAADVSLMSTGGATPQVVSPASVRRGGPASPRVEVVTKSPVVTKAAGPPPPKPLYLPVPAAEASTAAQPRRSSEPAQQSSLRKMERVPLGNSNGQSRPVVAAGVAGGPAMQPKVGWGGGRCDTAHSLPHSADCTPPGGVSRGQAGRGGYGLHAGRPGRLWAQPGPGGGPRPAAGPGAREPAAAAQGRGGRAQGD